ncbi:hypothetical protein TNCV_1734781 [Trichonephila clavipes]|nr:hypothetical protein TNCV_1734781 [Trichonephila clavipes]
MAESLFDAFSCHAPLDHQCVANDILQRHILHVLLRWIYSPSGTLYGDSDSLPQRDSDFLPQRDSDSTTKIVTLYHKEIVTLYHKEIVTLYHKEIVTLYHKEIVTLYHKEIVTLYHKEIVTLYRRVVKSEISLQIWKRDLKLIARWDLKMEIVSPDDPDQNNGAKLLNFCVVIGS